MMETTSRVHSLVAGALWLILGTVPAWSTPPPTETLERLEGALAFLESPEEPVAYTMKTRSVIAKPNGKSREEILTELRVSREPGGEPERTLVHAVRNGEDVTAEFREEMDQARAKRKRKARDEEESRETSVSFTLPGADELSRHRFDAPLAESGLLVASFEPGSDPGDTAGTGRLAWDPDTLDPVWLEFVPEKNPKHIKRMSMRVELARMADRLVLARTVTEGLGGFLFIKRTFEMEMEVTDVTVGGALQGTAGVDSTLHR